MRSNHLSSDDWRCIATFLADAAVACSLDALVAGAVGPLRLLFGADLIVWDTHDREARPIAFRLEPDLSARVGALRDPFLEHFCEHPLSNPVLMAGYADSARPFQLSDHIGTRRFLQTGLWSEIYLHLLAKHQIAMLGRVSGQLIWTVAANRLGRDYGTRERELARFLQPRLNQLIGAAVHRENAARAATTFSQFLHDPAAAFALVTPDGRDGFATESARSRLAELGATDPSAGRPSTWTDVKRILRSSARVFSQVRVSGRLSALLLRMPDGGVLVLMQDETATATASQLTAREREVFGWLGEGKSNAEIAAILHVRPRTVEKHCENLLAKLGVESRLAAALLARSGAPLA